MKLILRWNAAVAALVALAGALCLSACIVSPGKFDALFLLRKDGTFTFSYNGQIYLLALGRLAEMSAENEANEEFVASACYDDDFVERPCTEDEVAGQREEWSEQAERRKQQAAREAEQMRHLLGGIDPSNPEAAEEIAARLRRQDR